MPTLYMMVGLPGSGKSYFAENALIGVTVHSSDKIREEILGDITDQSRQELVFQTLHNRVLADLIHGKDTVYDATNTNYRRRMAFLQWIAARHIKDLKTVCVFMATPYQKCLENNHLRDRSVPDSVIDRMYKHFDVPMLVEGWNEIWIRNDQPLDSDSLIKRLSDLEHNNPHHDFTVGQHMLAAWAYFTDNYAERSGSPLELATYLHDIGKESTKVFTDAKSNPTDVAHYYHHENVGAYDSFSYTGNLATEDRLMVALLIRWHMYPFTVEKSEHPVKTKKRLLSLLGAEIYNDLLILHECDKQAH